MTKQMALAFDYAKAVGEMIEKRFGQGLTVRMEDEFILIDEWIEITPTKISVKTISGEIEKDGFLLSIAVVQHNYPHEPDDVDTKEIAEFESAQQAVTEAFHYWFDCWIENAIETHNITRMVEEE